ncbi:hypothetical protein [Liquorilactobacillus hordei]|uniref:hypothetical protein n=1 Tax=Liquorilactobacillus hordei TaxID=468911 RepID=UPI0039ED6C98
MFKYKGIRIRRFHRLVNELDLNILGNTLNLLDSVSKSAIPSLTPGSAILRELASHFL